MSCPYKKLKHGEKSAANANYRRPCKYYQVGRCVNPRCPFLHVRGTTDDSPSKDSTSSKTADLLMTVLKLFFEKQQCAIYKSEEGLLDLSRLSHQNDLQSIASSINFNTNTFCKTLCRCIGELIVPAPSLVNLDGNCITHATHILRGMHDAGLHTTLRALSLAHNEIKTLDFITALKPFTSLVELNLVGNPVTKEATYKQSVKSRLPLLLGLDGEGIQASPLALPWPHCLAANHVSADDHLRAVFFPTLSSPPLDPTQRSILEFLYTSVFGPLEQGAGGVDAMADAYAVHTALSLCLSCSESAVATPLKTIGGHNPTANRLTIREIVGLRLRQTEGDHNLLVRGTRSSQVALGRVRVCAQLEHWLYPKTFVVRHYLHPSISLVVMENNGPGSVEGGVKQAMAAVTVHGVMAWCHRTTGPSAPNSSTSEGGGDSVVIKRNFTRTFTIVPRGSLRDNPRAGMATAGADWVIVNDMILLLPFNANDPESDAHAKTPPLVLATPAFLFGEPVYTPKVLFSPATDATRITRYGRKYNVPASVVATLCTCVQNDRELTAILVDLSGIPLASYEHCAELVSQNPLAAVFLCRLGNCYGIVPDAGVALLQEHGLDWTAIQQSIQPETTVGKA